MTICPVCQKANLFSKFKTVGEQVVCSLSCVGLLKSNSKDSCDGCKRPVWKDNYYKINNKYYCSEICKNKIIKKLNLQYDSKAIQHIQDIIFSDNNDNIVLKNSKQLREEVLKFYKDFQFDYINDDIYINTNGLNNNNSLFGCKGYKNIISNKDKKYKKNTVNIDIMNSFHNSKSKYCNLKKVISNNNRNNRKYTLTKAFTSLNIQKERNCLKYKTKNINKEQIKKINNTSNNNRYLEIKSQNENERIENNMENNLYLYRNNRNKNYSFLNNLESKIAKNKYNTINFNNSSGNKNGDTSYNELSKNRKSPIIKANNKIECMKCGTKLGNVKILDRNRNAFCSDYCKESYLKLSKYEYHIRRSNFFPPA